MEGQPYVFSGYTGKWGVCVWGGGGGGGGGEFISVLHDLIFPENWDIYFDRQLQK